MTRSVKDEISERLVMFLTGRNLGKKQSHTHYRPNQNFHWAELELHLFGRIGSHRKNFPASNSFRSSPSFLLPLATLSPNHDFRVRTRSLPRKTLSSSSRRPLPSRRRSTSHQTSP